MPRLLSIGEFSRIAHLSVKTLRHYDDVGLLAPLRVDADTGYRYYATEQLPSAQVIRRLRALDVSVPDVKAVLDAPDVATRHALLARHLEQRETALARAQATVASLRALLQRESGDAKVTYQSIPATPALAIRAVVDHHDVAAWWQGAVGELRATLRAQSLRAVGPVCGHYDASLFADERRRYSAVKCRRIGFDGTSVSLAMTSNMVLDPYLALDTNFRRADLSLHVGRAGREASSPCASCAPGSNGITHA